MTASSQTRLLAPIGSDVRFQAIGKDAGMSEIGALSGLAVAGPVAVRPLLGAALNKRTLPSEPAAAKQ